MNGRKLSTRLASIMLGVGIVLMGPSAPWAVQAASHTFEPAQVVPLDQIAPAQRENVAEVIREANFHRQGKPETFPANPRLYLTLLNEPVLTLSLWQDLAATPAVLKPVGPGKYQGTDGNGTTATWEYVYRSPRQHVMLCTLDYSGPHGHPRLSGRIVLVVHTSFFKEPSGEPWVKHDIEAFVKIDSRGWKAVATTVRPLIEKLLEDQVQEAGWFVSLMARLVEMYPGWAIGVAQNQPLLPETARQGFHDMVVQNRRAGALEGRPRMIADADQDKPRR